MVKNSQKPQVAYEVEADDGSDLVIYRDRAPAEQHVRILEDHGVEARVRTLDLAVRVPRYKSVFVVQVDLGAVDVQYRKPRAVKRVLFEDHPHFGKELPYVAERGTWVTVYARTPEDSLSQLYGFIEAQGYTSLTASWREAS
ncbi:hypothetical protein [Nitriliruptor alkaliphilus]|uniref:hypothetical protein n=1 Tax=Nitriliruptor alkaliphilus TaxID=427918 RepID=UPI00069637A3|nr:hypothetical protein [Nitriliruptor alkaliphilus]